MTCTRDEEEEAEGGGRLSLGDHVRECAGVGSCTALPVRAKTSALVGAVSALLLCSAPRILARAPPHAATEACAHPRAPDAAPRTARSSAWRRGRSSGASRRARGNLRRGRRTPSTPSWTRLRGYAPPAAARGGGGGRRTDRPPTGTVPAPRFSGRLRSVGVRGAPARLAPPRRVRRRVYAWRRPGFAPRVRVRRARRRRGGAERRISGASVAALRRADRVKRAPSSRGRQTLPAVAFARSEPSRRAFGGVPRSSADRVGAGGANAAVGDPRRAARACGRRYAPHTPWRWSRRASRRRRRRAARRDSLAPPRRRRRRGARVSTETIGTTTTRITRTGGSSRS